MKSRLTIALLSFALGLNTALLVVVLLKMERIEYRMAAREDRGGPDKSMVWGLPRVDPERLGLTEQQQKEIEALRQKWKEEEIERRKDSMQRHEKIPELFENPDVTFEELLPFLEKAHEESKARLEALLRLYRAYQDILTPEQQEQFKEMIREQQQRHRAMAKEARMHMQNLRGGNGEGPGNSTPGENPRVERMRRLMRRNQPNEETTFAPRIRPMRPGMPGMEPGREPEMGANRDAGLDDFSAERPMPGGPMDGRPTDGDPMMNGPMHGGPSPEGFIPDEGL